MSNQRKWALLTNAKGSLDFLGLYPSEIEALYAAYLNLDFDSAEDVLSEYIRQGYIGDRSLSYHVVEAEDPPTEGSTKELEEFDKLFHELKSRPRETPTKACKSGKRPPVRKDEPSSDSEDDDSEE